MSENRMPRKNVGPTRDEVIREWRQLHNEELHDLYSSPNIIWVIKSRRNRKSWRVPSMGRGEMYTGRGVLYRDLVVNPEGKRPLGRPSRRWENKIKMNLQEVEWGHRLNNSGSR
jgi:hypothetical protein